MPFQGLEKPGKWSEDPGTALKIKVLKNCEQLPSLVPYFWVSKFFRASGASFIYGTQYDSPGAARKWHNFHMHIRICTLNQAGSQIQYPWKNVTTSLKNPGKLLDFFLYSRTHLYLLELCIVRSKD